MADGPAPGLAGRRPAVGGPAYDAPGIRRPVGPGVDRRRPQPVRGHLPRAVKAMMRLAGGPCSLGGAARARHRERAGCAHRGGGPRCSGPACTGGPWGSGGASRSPASSWHLLGGSSCTAATGECWTTPSSSSSGRAARCPAAGGTSKCCRSCELSFWLHAPVDEPDAFGLSLSVHGWICRHARALDLGAGAAVPEWDGSHPKGGRVHMERTCTCTAHGHHGPESGRADADQLRPASAGLSGTVHRGSHEHPPPPGVGTRGPDGQSGSSLLVVSGPSTGSVIARLRPAVLGRADLLEHPAPTGSGSKMPWMPSPTPLAPAALPPAGLVTGRAIREIQDSSNPLHTRCHPTAPGWAGQQTCPSVVGLAAGCPPRLAVAGAPRAGRKASRCPEEGFPRHSF